MEYRIRTAVPAGEARIRELFLEMLRTVYNTNDVKGYEDGDLDRFWRKSSDRIYVAEDGQVVAFLSAEVYHDPVDHIYLDDFSVTAAYRNIPFERLHNPQIKLGNKTGNNSPLNERRRQILSEMRNNPNITTAQLMMLLGCAETTVENHIAYLRKNGYIERIGSRKAGWWKVKNSEDEA